MMKKNPRIAIILSTFHEPMVRRMEKAFCEIMTKHNYTNIVTYEVPGAFEIPLKAKMLAKTKKFDSLVAFGVVIKGDTMHFELIASQCVRGIMDVMLIHEIPIICEVLATYDEKQATIRTSGKRNKGIEAANALLKILSIS